MLCRLCLNECKKYLTILSESSGVESESEIAKIINKYFYMELNASAEISNKICTDCWQQLESFHKFWLSIEEKQESLRQQLSQKIKNDVEEALAAGEEQEILTDIKNIILCEPQIDAEPICEEQAATSEFELANDNDSSNDERVMEIETNNNDQFPAKRQSIKRKVKLKYQTRNVKKKSSLVSRKTRTSIKSKKTSLDQLETETETEKKINQNLATSREMDLYLAKNAVLSCCLCSKVLENFTVLLRHFRKEHHCRGYILCCNNRYTKRFLYVDHLKLHENPDLFKCIECNKVLASRNSYMNHMATIHPAMEQLKFQCEFCSRKFSKQYILDYHLKKHTNERKEHFCDICKKGFRDAYDLKNHDKRVHLNQFALICDICGKHFKSKQNFEIHKATVHQEQQPPEAQCEICKRWLKDQRSLYKHMYKHRDEESGKKFTCPKCGEEKSTRQKLVSHISYNHPSKMFKCSLCEKEFKRTRSLEEHMATHTGKVLYTCEFCTQTFKSHANKHNHKKKMHPNQWVRKYTQPRNGIDTKIATTDEHVS